MTIRTLRDWLAHLPDDHDVKICFHTHPGDKIVKDIIGGFTERNWKDPDPQKFDEQQVREMGSAERSEYVSKFTPPKTVYYLIAEALEIK